MIGPANPIDGGGVVIRHGQAGTGSKLDAMLPGDYFSLPSRATTLPR